MIKSPKFSISLNRIANFIGVDKAIFYTSSARIIQGLGGIISVLFIARYLTAIEQGFYFTFASILAIQIFFELGLNGIITQFVAHEVSHLVLNDNKFEGDNKFLSRMASLLHFCIKWYGVLALLLFLVLAIFGYVFFSHFYKAEIPVNWILPWLLLSVGTTFSFLISPFLAFVQGLGRVKQVARIRLIQQVTTMVVLWAGLFFGLKLFVGGISSLIGLSMLCIFVIKEFLPILRNIYKIKIRERVSYKNEIFPFQWKIALSWISGYFIFQIFNPVLFATDGAVVAGQMGMTLTVLNAIMGFTLSWINTKIPVFSGLIAQKKYLKLDKLFNKTLIQSSVINFIGVIVVFMTIFTLRYFKIEIKGENIAQRFLPYLPLIMMMIPVLLNHIISAWATYLRCHKREPMLIQSITIGVLCTLSIIVLGKYFGVIGITLGYMVLTVISFIWANFIFINNKKKWHNE